jgi:hypothetical protein
MTAIIIPNSTTFGNLTNTAVARLMGVNTALPRLADAVTTASTSYQGTPGTEFEAPASSTGGVMVPGGNNFGVQADPTNLGAQGTAYSNAVTALLQEWNTFWAAAEQYIQALDNGTPAT